MARSAHRCSPTDRDCAEADAPYLRWSLAASTTNQIADAFARLAKVFE